MLMRYLSHTPRGLDETNDYKNVSFNALRPARTLSPHCVGSLISEAMFNVQ